MPAEESAREQLVKRLISESRQRLAEPGSVYPADNGSTLHTVLSQILSALEASVDSSPVPEFVPAFDLSELEARLVGRAIKEARGESEQSFIISFPSIELTVSEIWPEGDAPENPTRDDVLAVMQEPGATPISIAWSWELIDTLYVEAEEDDPSALIWEAGE